MTNTPPRAIGTACFTRDMAETLLAYFETYATDGVIAVELTTHGLWLPHPSTGTRQFLGRADVPETPISYVPQILGS